MTITPELRHEAGDEPVRLEDPETHRAHVLLKAEVYERIREDLGDQRQRKAFRDTGLRSAVRWMKDNPY
jgi:hypothetical protein